MDWVAVTAITFTTAVVCITVGYIAGVHRAYNDGYDEAVRRSTPLLLLAGEMLHPFPASWMEHEEGGQRLRMFMRAGLVERGTGGVWELTELGRMAIAMRNELAAREHRA